MKLKNYFIVTLFLLSALSFKIPSPKTDYLIIQCDSIFYVNDAKSGVLKEFSVFSLLSSLRMNHLSNALQRF